MLVSSISNILAPRTVSIENRHRKALKDLAKANYKFEKAKGQIRTRAYKRKIYKKWVGSEHIGIKSWVPLWMVWVLIKLNIVGAKYVRVEPVAPKELESQKDV